MLEVFYVDFVWSERVVVCAVSNGLSCLFFCDGYVCTGEVLNFCVCCSVGRLGFVLNGVEELFVE